ncbi:hypothetical protein D3Y57_08040 [Sphingomonas paeninsulae]|uniref:Non-contractile tail sheath TIM barrel domain-containing protein n=1 Tax=Sphingomonas paeninsulae TaxID=2319844 RepID=A0A494TFZ4_SPHPE|nr:hypothetical protein D3Y57_08040 [Sphingomonas paeninsulae]
MSRSFEPGAEGDAGCGGAVLAASTAALFAAVRADHPATERLMLVFLPTVLDPPEAVRANVPVGWASPAFDVLQVEDYDWVTAGNTGASARGLATVNARLGYPQGKQHYLSGLLWRRRVTFCCSRRDRRSFILG